MGDERASACPDTLRGPPEPEAATGEGAIPDLRLLLKTPAGVLAAQRLAGNRAIQRLLRPATSVSRVEKGALAREADGNGQQLGGNSGDSAQPLDTSSGNVAYSYSKSSSSGGSFEFTDPDYNSLMATLTSRMSSGQEIGNCLPKVTLVLNGISIPQDGSAVSVPDDAAPVKTGSLTVVDNITLPTWTNVGSAAVQDAQRAEWTRYTGAVSSHEDLHAADDKSAYDPVAAGLGQKKIGAAIDAVSAATTAANAKAGPRDASNPPPTLKPVGTTTVP
ncbi:MAG TPA: hypothetical protein VH063_12675 [Gaiellaceae bacterium]|nr:hypothetical protein [Gaiellaceae bacterium]